MKILHVIETCGGGSGRYVLDLVRGLTDRNYSNTVVWSPLRAETHFIEELSGIPGIITHALPINRAIGRKDWVSFRALGRYITQTGPYDILHGHSSKAGALVRLLSKAIPGGRVYTPHAFRSMDPSLSYFMRGLYRKMELALHFQHPSWICVGSAQEADEAHTIGIDQRFTKTVRFGRRPPTPSSKTETRKHFGVPQDTFIVGFVGRLTHQKAPERLLNAFSMADIAKSALVFVGNGELLATLRAKASTLGISEKVIFLGEVDGQRAMPAFDILVVPSRYESLGYVILEAQAAGLPIISTPVGIATETIRQGKNGFVVANTDDPAELSSSINTIYNNYRSFKSSTGSKSRFSLVAMLDDMESIYREPLQL